MLHARLFREQNKYRDAHFQPTKESLTTKTKSEGAPWLDGNPEMDRPLFVQFCANKAEDFLEAAQYVAPYCDAVDLNLGCPQGIARSGHYGAFLQEDWDTIRKLIGKIKDELEVPVTAKFRIQETPEKTLEYANMILDAGASILTVHGRQRHQKGHNTGVADWDMIRHLREHLPAETVIFANGNILNGNDIEPCLEATGADGVMSAEGNLSDPTIFAQPPEDTASREYWRDSRDSSIGGYRIDGVLRRYYDIIYRHVLEQEPPQRAPLYVSGDQSNDIGNAGQSEPGSIRGTKRVLEEDKPDQPLEERPTKQSKKQKRKHNKKGKDMEAVHNPNLKPMQGHLFQLLRPMLATHTHIRDALARSRAGDMQAFENVLSMIEDAIKQGLDEEYASMQKDEAPTNGAASVKHDTPATDDENSSEAARERCRRPFWVCQPYVRPLPEEALKMGAMQLSKKEKEALAQRRREEGRSNIPIDGSPGPVAEDTSQAGVAQVQLRPEDDTDPEHTAELCIAELPRKEGLACG